MAAEKAPRAWGKDYMDAAKDLSERWRNAMDAIVAEVARQGSINGKSELLSGLTAWLLDQGEPEEIAHTVSQATFHNWTTDSNLCEHFSTKGRFEISDDLRLKHLRSQIGTHIEEYEESTCIQSITSRDGGSAVVAYVYCCNEDNIDRFLGAWPTRTGFWAEYLQKHVDLEFPPTDDEILRAWERDDSISQA